MEGGSHDRPPHTISPASFLGVPMWETQRWSSPTMRKQTNQPARRGRAGQVCHQLKQGTASYCKALYFFSPIQKPYPSSPVRKLIKLKCWFILPHSFLKISPKRLRNMSTKGKPSKQPRRTNLACKFFRIQHESFMGTGLLGDILSAVKLKNPPQYLPSKASHTVLATALNTQLCRCGCVWRWNPACILADGSFLKNS